MFRACIAFFIIFSSVKHIKTHNGHRHQEAPPRNLEAPAPKSDWRYRPFAFHVFLPPSVIAQIFGHEYSRVAGPVRTVAVADGRSSAPGARANFCTGKLLHGRGKHLALAPGL